MTKIKTIEDCRGGLDYLELAEREGWPVTKNGSYWEINTGETIVRFPNCNRTLPKQTRQTINSALIKAGLLVVLLAAVMAWIT